MDGRLFCLDFSPSPTILVSPTGRIENWNRAAEKTFGWSGDEHGKSLIHCAPPEHRKMLQLLLECASKGETLQDIDTGWTHKSGTPLAVLLTLAPVRSAQQEVAGIRAIFKNVTTRRTAEKTLQQAEIDADTLDAEKQTSARAEAESEPGPLGSRLILVAEDFHPNQEVIELQLRSLGCEVHIANDGFAAIAMARARRYDIILMDIRMPNMDGLEATRQIRRNEDPCFPPVPIIAVTADVQPRERQRCLDAGMNDYLEKPVRTKALTDTLRRWLQDQPSPPRPEQPSRQSPNVLRNALPEPVERLLRDLPPESTLTVLQTALAQISPQIEILLEALRNRDWAAVDAIAHRLKGTSKYYTEERFNQLLNRIRAYSADDFEASVDTLIEDLTSESTHIQQRLQQAIAELRARIA